MVLNILMSSSFSIACSYQPPLPADQVKPLVEFEYDAGNSCIQMEGKLMCTERITTKFLGFAELLVLLGVLICVSCWQCHSYLWVMWSQSAHLEVQEDEGEAEAGPEIKVGLCTQFLVTEFVYLCKILYIVVSCLGYLEDLLKCMKGQPHMIAMASGIGSQRVG